MAAYDFCRTARGRIGRRAVRRGQDVDVRILVLNELRTVLVAGAELAREERHLYARHLLGCLDDTARANLWTLGRMATRGGGRLFLEFSAVTDDPRATPPQPEHLVRRLDPARVRREIEASGGTVQLERLGPGQDVLGRFDPRVCRMKVTWKKRKSA